MAKTAENNRPFEPLLVEHFRKLLNQRALTADFVQWMSTKKCNFSCTNCGSDAGSEGDELTTREMFNVIDGLAGLGCRWLSVAGGEPLLRKDIFEVFAYAKIKKIKVSMVTNGYLTRDFIPELRKAGLHSVSVSIDGYRQNHDLIRGMKDSYEKCIDSLNIYREFKVPIVQVATVVLKENIADIPKITGDIFKEGCTRYRLQLLIPEGRAKNKDTPQDVVREALSMIDKFRRNKINIFAADNFGYLGRLGERVRKTKFLCGCGWWTFTIMQNGDIMGCPLTDHPELKEGNVRNADIKDIWWKGFRRFRDDEELDRLPSICRDCKHIKACRGGCWAQRVNAEEFCYLSLAENLEKERIHERRPGCVRSCSLSAY